MRRFTITLVVLTGVFVTALSGLQTAAAASATWNGSTDALWATTDNWLALPIPGTGDTATFNNSGNGNIILNLGGGGVTVKTVLFDTSSAAAYTIGSGAVNSQTLTLNDGGGVTMNATVANAELFNANILLGTATAGTYTVTNNSTANALTLAGNVQGGTGGTGAAKTLTVAGLGNTAISGNLANGGGTLALAKSGIGALTLTGSLSYTGPTRVSGGTLTFGPGASSTTLPNVTNVADGGNVVFDMGSSNSIVFNNTLYQYSNPPGGICVGDGTGPGGAAGTVGTVTLKSGYLQIKGCLDLGDNGGNGTYIQTGGTLNCSSTEAYLGFHGASTGVMTISGGLATFAGGIYWDAGSGTLNVTGGTVNVSTLQMPRNGTNATVNLDGGILIAANITQNSGKNGIFNFNGGTLQARSAGALMPGGAIFLARANVRNGGAIIDDGGFAATIGQPLLHSNLGDSAIDGGLTKLGSGTLTLGSTTGNTYTGNTLIAAGTLQLGHNLALLNSALDTSGTGTLAFSAGVNTPTFGGLTGANNLTLAANVTALTLNPGSGVTQNYSGNLGSATAGMTLTKTGAGTQVLSGSNSYTGGTTISAGALKFNGANSLPSGGTLAVAGAGTTLDLADGTARTHTVGGLTLTSGAVLKMDWDTSPTADLINTAATAATSGTVFLNPTGSYTSGTSYTFISAAGGLGGATYLLANNADYFGVPTVSGGTAVQLTPTASMALTAAYWKGGQVGGFTSSLAVSNGTLSNWASDAAGTATALVPGPGTDVYFSVTGGPGSYASPLLGADMTVDTVTFNASTGTVTIGAGNTLTISPSASTAGITASDSATINATVALGAAQTWTVAGTKTLTVGGAISGTSSLAKDGSGTLILTGANLYSGTTTISNGAVNIQNSSALGSSGSGTSVTSGAALQIQGNIATAAEPLTLNGTGVASTGALRNISGTNTYTGLVTLGSDGVRINSDAGTLTLSNPGSITGSGFGLTVGGAGNTTINSVIATGSGTLTKDGAGTLLLATANTYTGATTISVGVLSIQQANALGDTVAGTTVSATGAALQLQGYITTAPEPVTLNGTGVSSGGALRNISGDNTYTGLVTLGSAARINSDAGTLTLSNPASITGSGLGLTVGGAGNTTIYSIIGTGTGALTKDGAGMLALAGANTYTGSTTITVGTLQLGNGGTTGSLSLSSAIIDNATLAFNRTDTLMQGTDFASVISGTGGVAQAGSGITVLNGANIFTGGVAINAGTLRLGSSGALNSAAGSENAVAFGASSTGVLGLNGNSVVISNLSSNATPGSPIVQNANLASATLTVGNSKNLSGAFAGVIQDGTGGGTLGLTKTGAGTLTLSGTNTYTGVTTVSGNGTLKFAKEVSLYNSNTANWTAANIVVNAGATLALNVGGVGEFTPADVSTLVALGTVSGGFKDDSIIGLDTTNAVAGLGFTPSGPIVDPNGGANGLSLTKLGAGTLILDKANTYTGTTTLAGAGTVHLGITESAGTSGPLGNSPASNPGSIVLGGDTLRYSAVNQNDYSGRFSTAANQKYYVNTNGQNVTWAAGLVSSGGVLTKYGAGALTLAGSSTYTGLTTINGGTIKVDAGAGGALLNTSPYSALTFTGMGTFNYDNTTAALTKTQSMGTLTFSAGDGNVQVTRTASQNISLTFSSLAARAAGATRNFVTADTAGGGVNGTDYYIRLTGQGIGFIDQGSFFGGSNYAWMNAASPSYVRGIDYVTPDAGAENISASTASFTAGKLYEQVSGTGQITGQATQTITTLNIANANDFVIGAGNRLTVNGILKSGGAAGGTISGGTIGAAAELVLRADTASDTLAISSALDTGTGNRAVTKSGAGLVTLTGPITYGTGVMTVNGGTLAFSGNTIAGTGAIKVNGGGVLSMSSVTSTAAIGAISVGNNSGPAPGIAFISSSGTLVATAGINLGTSTGMGSPAGDQLTISGGYINTGINVGQTTGGIATLNIIGGNIDQSTNMGSFNMDVGNYGVGYFNMSGGTITAPYGNWANKGGAVVAYQTGGYNNQALGTIVNSGNGTLIYTITGGTLNFRFGNAGATTGGAYTLSALGTGLLTCGSVYSFTTGGGQTATLNIAGGTVTTTNGTGLTLATGASGLAVANLSGGQLFFNGTGGVAGTGGNTRMNLSGGTLKYGNNSASWLGGLSGAYVFPGGFTIDTMTYSGTVSQSLQPATGFGVSGVTLTNSGAGYTAAPVVSFSGGVTAFAGADAQAVATWDQASGLVTGITIVNPGQYIVPPTGVVLSRAAGSLDTWTTPATVGISTGINSGGGLTKTGTGTLTLSNSSTFNGPTTVSAGVLTLSNSLALQNSPLDTSGTGTVTLSVVTTPVFGGLKGSRNLFGTVITTGSGSVTALSLNPVAGASNTYSGVIANGAVGMALNITGPGTQTLAGNSTYTGPTAVQAGTLEFTSIANAGIASALGQPASANSTINLGSASASGTLRLVGSASSGTDRVVNLTGNGTIDASSSASEGLAFTGTGAASITNSGSYNLTLTGSGYGEIDKAVNLNGGGLNKNGAGTWLLSGSNSYTGGTTVNAGTLNIATADSLPTGGNVAISGGGHVVLASGLSHAISLGGLAITGGAGGASGAGVGQASSLVQNPGQAGSLTNEPAAATPEPGTIALLAAAALAGLAAWRRKRFVI